jgi:hypothetical protein
MTKSIYIIAFITGVAGAVRSAFFNYCDLVKFFKPSTALVISQKAVFFRFRVEKKTKTNR